MKKYLLSGALLFFIAPPVVFAQNNQGVEQQNIDLQLDKIDSRPGWVKTLFGTDYKAVKNIKRQLEQNRLRILELQELQNQTTNQSEEIQISELIRASGFSFQSFFYYFFESD